MFDDAAERWSLRFESSYRNSGAQSEMEDRKNAGHTANGIGAYVATVVAETGAVNAIPAQHDEHDDGRVEFPS
jgi:hypothetical protein